MKIGMVRAGFFRVKTKTLTTESVKQVEVTSNFLLGQIKPGERVMIYTSPRVWEVQTATIVQEVFSRADRKNNLVGVKSEIKILTWLYKTESGHIVVDNLLIEEFIDKQMEKYDYIIIVAGAEHVEGWPVFVTGSYSIEKVSEGQCVVIGHDNKLSYSKPTTPGPLVSQTGAIQKGR